MENGSLASLLLHVHGHSARSIVFNLAGAVSWPGFEDSHVTEITYAQPCVFRLWRHRFLKLNFDLLHTT